MSVQLLGTERDGVGESPVWQPRDATIWSVDITGRRILQRNFHGGECRIFETDDLPTAIALDHEGGAIVSFAGGIGRFKAGETSGLLKIEQDVQLRLNEGACDPSGRFWVASMENNLTPELETRQQQRAAGRLYRVDGDGVTAVSEREFWIPNTMVWSPEGDRFYLGDSLRNTIWVWDFDRETGHLSHRRVFAEGGPGIPDGSCVDSEGCLWNARFGAGRIIRYDPDGEIEREVPLPAVNPTATAFAGDDMQTLVVTSARFGLTHPGEADGAMMLVHTEVVGRTAHRYVPPQNS